MTNHNDIETLEKQIAELSKSLNEDSLEGPEYEQPRSHLENYLGKHPEVESRLKRGLKGAKKVALAGAAAFLLNLYVQHSGSYTGAEEEIAKLAGYTLTGATLNRQIKNVIGREKIKPIVNAVMDAVTYGGITSLWLRNYMHQSFDGSFIDEFINRNPFRKGVTAGAMAFLYEATKYIGGGFIDKLTGGRFRDNY